MSGLNETTAGVQAVDISSSSNLVPEALSNFLAGLTSNGFLSLGLFLLLLALGVALHRLNMEKTYRMVAATSKTEENSKAESNTSGGEVSRDELREEMFTRQGSNFNAAAVAAWLLLFVAFAYFYFLTKDVFVQHNYFQLVPALASGPLGFATFGLGVLLLSFAVAAFIPKEVYGYYEISRKMKVAIMLTVPLLAISIILSVQQATIFPQVELGPRLVAFLALFASELALLWPIYTETLGGMR
ncbi:hypothetical protein [Methanocrinis sp.]|uniref:hypothetical protein n=1 Tax=Methanocrinis sp. TaxID=3101522 RepID=UPI003D0C4CAF